jgi:hypothetical protein
MWIVKKSQPPRAYQHQVGLLWKAPSHPAVYVMDCHLAALWCWLQHLSVDDEYSLLHIDGHWDANLPADNVLAKLIQLKTPSLEDFLALEDRHPLASIGIIPGITWDNFIAPITHLRPRIKSGVFIVHQKQSQGWEQSQFWRQSQFTAIPASFKSWDTTFKRFWRTMKGRRIVDLDIDYFFTGPENANEVLPRLDKQRAMNAGIAIKKNVSLADGDIMTIALSPQCSGGFGNAEEACRIICDHLEIDLPAQLGWPNTEHRNS